MSPDNIKLYIDIFQVVGWPGVFAIAAWRVWVWYTTIRWPQERQDRKDAEAARAKREDDWYSLIGKTVSNGEKILMILALAHPEHASAVNRTTGDRP